MSQYYGDIFQYRLAFEHFLDDAKGFGYAVELVGIHGLPFRLDGQSVNAGHVESRIVFEHGQLSPRPVRRRQQPFRARELDRDVRLDADEQRPEPVRPLHSTGQQLPRLQ